jgi:hypothetical protein
MISKKFPVAIGGIGGSGTRVVASVLRELGYYIGSDLNEANDNLWFTLLFKRSQVLLETDVAFSHLNNLFWRRMDGDAHLDKNDFDLLKGLAIADRAQHSKKWLEDRVWSWCNEPATSGAAWGWKEPNTHIVIDRMLRLHPDLIYIHVLRNPLDMALSANQNQQGLWGPILLGKNLQKGPIDSMSYCCSAIRRLQAIALQFPNRIHFVKFEDLCSNPGRSLLGIGSFVGAEVNADNIQWLSDQINMGSPGINRYREIDIMDFNDDDLEFVQKLGYSFG